MAQPYMSTNEMVVNETLSANPAYGTQVAAPLELRILSQPPSSLQYNQYEDYVYRADRKSLSYIYHAEVGINEQHKDFRKPVTWLYTGLAEFLGKDTPNEAVIEDYWYRELGYQGHSTCTASKLFGTTYGASKYTQTIVVKMADWSEDSILGIINAIEKDIREKGRQGKLVVNISWGSGLPQTLHDLSPEWSAFYDVCKALNDLSVFLVVPAGNFATYRYKDGTARLYMDTAPAIFAYQLPMVIPVGNTKDPGQRYEDSQAINRSTALQYGSQLSYLPQIHAPGVDVECADSSSQTLTRKVTGTSFCKCLQTKKSSDMRSC